MLGSERVILIYSAFIVGHYLWWEGTLVGNFLENGLGWGLVKYYCVIWKVFRQIIARSTAVTLYDYSLRLWVISYEVLNSLRGHDGHVNHMGRLSKAFSLAYEHFPWQAEKDRLFVSKVMASQPLVDGCGVPCCFGELLRLVPWLRFPKCVFLVHN